MTLNFLVRLAINSLGNWKNLVCRTTLYSVSSLLCWRRLYIHHKGSTESNNDNNDNFLFCCRGGIWVVGKTEGKFPVTGFLPSHSLVGNFAPVKTLTIWNYMRFASHTSLVIVLEWTDFTLLILHVVARLKRFLLVFSGKSIFWFA